MKVVFAYEAFHMLVWSRYFIAQSAITFIIQFDTGTHNYNAIEAPLFHRCLWARRLWNFTTVLSKGGSGISPLSLSKGGSGISHRRLWARLWNFTNVGKEGYRLNTTGLPLGRILTYVFITFFKTCIKPRDY